jgi:hypothetical protein
MKARRSSNTEFEESNLGELSLDESSSLPSFQRVGPPASNSTRGSSRVPRSNRVNSIRVSSPP